MRYSSLLAIVVLLLSSACIQHISISRSPRTNPVEIDSAYVLLDGDAVEVNALIRGSVSYHTNWCRKCHYSGARAGGSARGPSLVDDEWLHCDGSISGMVSVIRSGIPLERIHNKEQAQHEKMPAAHEMELTERDVLDIATYVHAIARIARVEQD